jgi:type I restriction enzyme S subunit
MAARGLQPVGNTWRSTYREPVQPELSRLPNLPPNWIWTSLGTIAEIKLGKMLSPKAYEDGLIQLPYLRNENVRWGRIDFSDVKYMGFKDRELERYGLQPNDLLVCEGGEPGRAAVYLQEAGAFMYQKALHRVRPIGGITDPRFIQLCFQYFTKAGSVIPRGSETTIQHLPLERMEVLPIPFPPVDEQDRIVAEIEKHFTRLDAGVASLKRAQSALKRYRASVLKAACEGRLVPTEAELARREGRSYETGEQLLSRVLKERRDKWEAAQRAKFDAAGEWPKDDRWKMRYKEPGVRRNLNLPTLSEGWFWASVETISTKVADGVHKKPSYVASGIPFVTVRNLTAGPGISFAKLNFVSKEDHRVFINRADPQRGDILISKDGTLGVVRVIECDTIFSIFVSVALIKPVMREMSRYLGVALRSPQVQAQMVPKGSGLQHIHLEDLREDCVPLPPFAEQQRIAEEVERRFSVLDKLEMAISANLKRADRLRQSILYSAFTGKP